MEGMKKLYVQADEICEDWGISKSQAYKMLQENPNLIVLAGKVNRKYYEHWGRKDYWKPRISVSPGAMHPAGRSLL